ncbi:hypothetical protein SLS62_002452 [Diatrype stigma]|uniref:F-box domain-containing protein n=1 Tax=Diatrype stigma TaxID=117547 RepID=A0AAN9UUG8_9PEZI
MEQQQAAPAGTSTAALAKLPHEMLLHVFAHLAPPDLARLSAVSRRVGGIASSLLWTDIELHQRGWHELCDRWRERDELPVPPGDEELAQRRDRCYFPPVPHCGKDGGIKVHETCNRRANGFFWACGEDSRVASRVRTLCTVVSRSVIEGEPGDAEDSTPLLGWGVFAQFTNLERLELHGAWEKPEEDGNADEEGDEMKERFSGWASAPPLPRLRSAVLYGHLPRNLVRYVLRSAPTLERLELGVLDEPRRGLDGDADDDAYWGVEYVPSDAWCYAPRALALHLDEQGVGRDDEGEEEEGGDNQEESDDEGGRESNEALKHLKFPNLKYMHLCKPTECRPSRYSRFQRGIKHSYAAEEGSTRDWELLVRAAAASRRKKEAAVAVVGEEGGGGKEEQPRADAAGGDSESKSEPASALETLVLEHRPVDTIYNRDSATICNRSFMRKWSGGPAEKRVVDGVLAPVFDEGFRDDDYDGYEREGVSVFPRLRRVYLRGMFVGDPVRRPESSRVPERIGAPWRRLGVQWTTCVGQWCLFDTGFDSSGETEWAPWAARWVDYADYDGDADGADNDHYGDDDVTSDDDDDDDDSDGGDD